METYIERIEAYLGAGMPEEERRRFEADLETDQELQTALDLYRQGNQLIEWSIAGNLREQLQTWAKEEQAPKKAKVISLRQWGMAIAAALALMLALWFVFDRQATPAHDNVALVAAFYQMPIASDLRGNGNEENVVAPGLKMLNEYQASAARDYFSNLLENDPGNLEYLYYLGHSAMIMKDWAAASAAFAAVETAPQIALAQKAAWNHALALLAAGNNAEFEARIIAIAADPAHSYREQAEVLQRQARIPSPK